MRIDMTRSSLSLPLCTLFVRTTTGTDDKIRKNRVLGKLTLTRWLPRVFSMKSPSGHECGIDYSDQMVFYATTIRKGIKWYGKLGVQFLLAISVVQALTIYKIATRKNINIGRFRELLTAKLLRLSQNTKNHCLRRSQHNIAVRKNDSGRIIRRACELCYADKRCRTDRSKTRENLKKTITYCSNWPDNLSFV